MSHKIDRTGEEIVNERGTIMIIIKYNNANDLQVYFPQYDYICKSRYSQFAKGKVKCPYEPIVFGVGYMGVGKYIGIDNEGKLTKCYNTWVSILERGYDEKYKRKRPTYTQVKVASEWHNFQNFAKWYEENYYTIEGERMELDKDILYKGNKIYSPQTCVFVPSRINSLFIKCDKMRGELPIGVSRHSNGYRCSFTKNKKRINSPTTQSIQDAFNWYKVEKEKYIKEVANEYKDKIPNKLYEVMMIYEVEIND